MCLRVNAGSDPNSRGKMIMTVFAGIAEFEHDLIQEQTPAGQIAHLALSGPQRYVPSQTQISEYPGEFEISVRQNAQGVVRLQRVSPLCDHPSAAASIVLDTRAPWRP